MATETKMLAMVAQIYDAAASPELWPVFLSNFAEAIEGTGAAMLLYDGSLSKAYEIIGVGLDPHYMRLYRQYYSGINPWLRSWKAQHNKAGLASISTSDEKIELQDLKKTEFYNDYLLPQRTIHQVGCMIAQNEYSYSGLTCLRPALAGPFDRKHLELIESLFPHLERGHVFRQKMAVLEGRNQASLDALDQLSSGVLLLDNRGRVLAANQAAADILSDADGLIAGPSGLSAGTSDETRRLHSLLSAVSATSKGSGFAAGGTLYINRPSGRRPYVLVVMPTSRQAFPPEAGLPGAIVFVNDPETTVRTPSQIIADAYQLSRAEANVAERLAQGESLIDAAENLGISHNTARTHLQRIYHKTGTGHQAELVRLLIRSTINLPD